jgi:hypothetical protein
MVATNWLLCHFYTLKQGHVGVKHTYIPDGYFCGEITQYNLVYEVSTKDLPARAFHIQKKKQNDGYQNIIFVGQDHLLYLTHDITQWAYHFRMKLICNLYFF